MTRASICSSNNYNTSMTSCKIIVLVFVVVLMAHACRALDVHVNPSTHMFIESTSGRELFFHGTNVVYKGFPYIPRIDKFDVQYSFAQEDYKILRDLGLNIVRLGVMWPGVEPIRNSYNYTYLNELSKIVNSLNEYGINVLLDFHQDVFSEKFCGEGVPPFAAIPRNDAQHKPFPFPLANPFPVNNETGYPSEKDCKQFSWDQYFFTEAVASAFQNLYDNYNGILDSFAQYWQIVVKQFLKSPNVIGYDLFNEPFAGDIFLDPSLLVPGAADRRNLQRVYETVAKAIRQVDEKRIIFIESVTWDEFAVGFDETPGGAAFKNRTALSYHYYTPPMISAAQAFRARLYDMNRLQIGGMLTEFDVSYADGIQNMIATMDLADQHLQSWIGWEYKPYVPITGWSWGLFNENGTLNEYMVKATARTYAKAVAGTVQNMQFNSTSSEFKLQFQIDITQRLPTEIFMSQELHYPNGFTVNIEPANVASFTLFDARTIHIKPTETAKMGQAVTITIKPK